MNVTCAQSGTGTTRATLVECLPDGRLSVVGPDGKEWTCDWLDSDANRTVALAIGDAVLISHAAGGPVVLGRIGRYRPPAPAENLDLSATRSLRLQCGESSLTLQSDGKVLLKGDDVVVRAKGTKRIRAGHVAIN